MAVLMQIVILYLSLIVSLKTEAVSRYVYYPTLSRHCIPYLKCEPGNQIQPCTDNYMQDLCKPCRTGMVQPDLISSTGNISQSLCFRSTSKCLARVCIPCPNGTFKNETGCGPCRYMNGFDSMPAKNSQALPTEHYMNARPLQKLSTETLIIVFKLRSSKPLEKDDSKMFIIIAVLGVSLVVLLVFIITICKRKSGISFSGSISLTDGTKHDKQQDERPIPLHDQHLRLLHANQGTQQDKPHDGRQDAFRNNIPLLQNNHINTMGNKTGDSDLINKYLPSYSTDGSNSYLMPGVSSFKDLDHGRCDGSIEYQIDNLKQQVFSGENQTNPQCNRRTLRKVPTESEDENSVARVLMSDLETKDENCNNVSERFLTSGNTDVDEHSIFAYKRNSMRFMIQKGSVDEYVNNSYSSGYKSSTLNYTKDYNDPMS